MTKNNVEKKLTRILNINEIIFSQRLKQLDSIVLGIFAPFKSLPISRITIVGFFSQARTSTEQVYDGFSVGKGYFGHDLTCISNDHGPFAWKVCYAFEFELCQEPMSIGSRSL